MNQMRSNKIKSQNVELVGIPDKSCRHVSSTMSIFEKRAVKTLAVRDTVVNPFSVDEFTKSPCRKMSRYLLTFLDVETNKRIRVFQRTLEGQLRDCPLRVGIFKSGVIIDLLASNWGPNVRDRMALVKFLSKFDQADFGDCCLGVFSDDLELIG